MEMRGDDRTVFAPTICTYKVILAVQSTARFTGHIAICPNSHLINLVLVELVNFLVPLGHLRPSETGLWTEILDL